MAWMSITGRRTGMFSSLASRVIAGTPLRITLMSVLVPPMSMVMMCAAPASSATCALATTPPAGPESTVCTGFLRAEATVISPPEASITITGVAAAMPRPRASRSRLVREPR